MILIEVKLYITGVSTAPFIVNSKNLISFEFSLFDRSDLKLPSFGIISNTGNIEFNDYNGEILRYAENNVLQSGIQCEVFIKNSLYEQEGVYERIANLETANWDYDYENKVVSVSLKDELEEWQDINVEGTSYDPRVDERKPFSWLYEYLWKLTSNNSYVNDNGEELIGEGNYNMPSIVDLDKNTKAVLNNTYIQYPLLKSGSLWQQWNKLCQVCQLHIYQNNDGIVVCKYNGGN
jgi:hypothetical protein